MAGPPERGSQNLNTRSVQRTSTRAPYTTDAPLSSTSTQSLFGQPRKDGRLVLVSCTDWDGKDYLSNIIVFAKQVRPEGDAA